MHILKATEAFGPLDHSGAQAIALGVVSVHQIQQQDEFTMLVILPEHALLLDAAGFGSVVDYLVKYYPDQDKTAHFLRLQGGLKIRPKPEPEVAACKPQPVPAAPPVNPPFEERIARWKARIRTRMRDGIVNETKHELVDVDELEQIVDRLPWYREDIKHIKIKLEPK
ncbi:hypothetical protein ACCS91_33630 [Rhizobium ruizarguesonis]